jgi:hypothetical protein
MLFSSSLLVPGDMNVDPIDGKSFFGLPDIIVCPGEISFCL